MTLRGHMILRRLHDGGLDGGLVLMDVDSMRHKLSLWKGKTTTAFLLAGMPLTEIIFLAEHLRYNCAFT